MSNDQCSMFNYPKSRFFPVIFGGFYVFGNDRDQFFCFCKERNQFGDRFDQFFFDNNF